MRFVLAFCASAALLGSAVAVAGEVSYADGVGSWASTGCTRPATPVFTPGDATALNQFVLEYNAFAGAVERYNDCLRAEAERDMAGANDAVQRALTAAQSDIIREATELREQLTRAR